MATATRVQFYHNTPDPLAFACEMVARAWGSGRKVAVQVATNQLELLTAHSRKCTAGGDSPISVQTYPKDSDAQLALRSGKVVAHVLTKPAAAWTACSRGCTGARPVGRKKSV